MYDRCEPVLASPVRDGRGQQGGQGRQTAGQASQERTGQASRGSQAVDGDGSVAHLCMTFVGD